MATVGDMTNSILSLLNGRRPPRSNWSWTLAPIDRPVASKNHDTLAWCCEVLDAFLAGDRKRLDAGLAWWSAYFTLALLRGESPGRIYPHWQYIPAYIVWSLSYADGRHAELIERGRVWLRGVVGYIVFAAGRGPGRTITDHHKERTQRIGGEITGDGGLLDFGPFIAWPGARSWSRLRDVETDNPALVGNFHHLDRNPGLCAPLIELGLSPWRLPNWTWEDKVWVALRKRWPGVPPWALSEAEVAVARRALGDDVEALAEVAGWCDAAPRPVHEYTFERRSGGVFGVALRLPPSSTGRLSFCSWETGDVTRFLSADNGGRDTGADDHDVDSECLGWIGADDGRAHSRRTDGHGGEVTCAVPGGAMIARLETGPGGVRFVLPSDPIEPPVPPPGPVPPSPPSKPPKRKPWWQRIVDC